MLFYQARRKSRGSEPASARRAPINVMLPVFLLWAMGSVSSCGPGVDLSVPDPLVGVWRTGAPGYADRFLEFTGKSVIFGTSEYTYESYEIKSIEKAEVKMKNGSPMEGTLYKVSYTDTNGEDYLLSFFYDGENGGLITFKNQEQLIWARDRG